MVHLITGDATLPKSSPAIIAHVCNDVGKFGAGFALALLQRYPNTRDVYLEQFEGENEPQLGDVIFMEAIPKDPGGRRVQVAHMIAQRNVRHHRNPHPLKYGALEKALLKVTTHAWTHGLSIHMPRIGSGLSGGDWEKILPVIERSTRSVDTYIYTLPQ